MEVNGQCYVLATLALGKNPGTYVIGCWVGPRAGVDDKRKTKQPKMYLCIN